MELTSTNLTFCKFVSMKERLTYSQHPQNPKHTLMTSEMVITVRNVPLTSYMESIILNTVSNNAGKGRKAMEWVVDKFEHETKPISDYLDKLKLEVMDLKHIVADSAIKTAQVSIDDLQRKILKGKNVSKAVAHEVESIAEVEHGLLS